VVPYSAPIAVRRLVDAGVEPIVVAKTLAIGDRDGGLMYRLSTRAGAFALAEHEAIAVEWVSLAIRDADPDLAADVMVSGATWIATPYGVDRDLLVNLVTGTSRRPPYTDRRGYGVVDLVDHHGVGDRASIATAIRSCQLPMFAPLEGAPFRGRCDRGAGMAGVGAAPLDRKTEALYRGERWAAVGRLVQGITPIPWSPAEALAGSLRRLGRGPRAGRSVRTCPGTASASTRTTRTRGDRCADRCAVRSAIDGGSCEGRCSRDPGAAVPVAVRAPATGAQADVGHRW